MDGGWIICIYRDAYCCIPYHTTKVIKKPILYRTSLTNIDKGINIRYLSIEIGKSVVPEIIDSKKKYKMWHLNKIKKRKPYYP